MQFIKERAKQKLDVRWHNGLGFFVYTFLVLHETRSQYNGDLNLPSIRAILIDW